MKDFYAWRFLMNFYVFIYKKEGDGCLNARICIGTHIQSFLENGLMDFYKTWQIWNTHGPAPVSSLFANSAQGLIKGGAKID